jgi:hypothetical protein
MQYDKKNAGHGGRRLAVGLVRQQVFNNVLLGGLS